MNSLCHIIIFLVFSVHFGRLVADTEGLSLELIHRDSIDPPGNMTDTEKLDRFLGMSSTVGLDGLNIRPIVSCEGYLYLVNVRIGHKDVKLGLDTGSSLIWTQSDPCNPCFPRENNYKPDQSPAFQRLPTNHPTCVGRYARCAYHKTYDGGSIYTKGVLGTDDFSFASRYGTKTFPLVFGASNQNSPNFFETKKQVSGVFAMGAGSISFLSQVHDRVGGRFAFCLVPPDRNGPNSYLRFGKDVKSNNYPSTKLVKLAGAPYYYVALEGVSVNRKRLRLPKGTFAPPSRTGEAGGCVFDTGAPMVSMIAPAYDAIKSALVDYFANFRELVPFAYRAFDICYRISGRFDAFPTVDLHFKAGRFRAPTMRLGRDQLLYTFGHGDQFCVMIVRTSRVTIVGAIAMQNTHVVYDVKKEKVYFAPKNCAQINGR